MADEIDGAGLDPEKQGKRPAEHVLDAVVA
jgi:hypothetical protein